jgi:hypothetical protein
MVIMVEKRLLVMLEAEVVVVAAATGRGAWLGGAWLE